MNSKIVDWITPDGLARIEGWAHDGLTLEQIAKNCNCSTSTLREWNKKNPAISAALKTGRDAADYQVENALYKRATGYEYDETTYVRSGSGGDMKAIRQIHKTALPDITAIIYWLKNRRPEKWRDKRNIDENAEQSVTIRFQNDAEEASK